MQCLRISCGDSVVRSQQCGDSIGRNKYSTMHYKGTLRMRAPLDNGGSVELHMFFVRAEDPSCTWFLNPESPSGTKERRQSLVFKLIIGSNTYFAEEEASSAKYSMA